MGQLYKPGPIEPIVLPGENILTQFSTGYELYQAVYIEPLPMSPDLAINLLANISGGLAAGQSTTQKISSSQQLTMQNGELGQFRWFVGDDAQVQMYEPQANPRSVMKNAVLRIDAFTHLNDPFDPLSEFFVFEDETPYFNVTNPTGSTISFCRIFPYGFRYVLAGKNGTVTGSSKALQPFERFSSFRAALDWRNKNRTQFIVVPVAGWTGGS